MEVMDVVRMGPEGWGWTGTGSSTCSQASSGHVRHVAHKKYDQRTCDGPVMLYPPKLQLTKLENG